MSQRVPAGTRSLESGLPTLFTCALILPSFPLPVKKLAAENQLTAWSLVRGVRMILARLCFYVKNKIFFLKNFENSASGRGGRRA